VLYTQLEQMRKQGSYDAFDMQWQEVYNVRRLTGARTRVSVKARILRFMLRDIFADPSLFVSSSQLDGIPPSLFWESDVGKW
jgi:hypothetical protein